MSKLKSFLCRLLGHKFDSVDMLMFMIKHDAINADKLNATIICTRCGERWKSINA